MKNLMKIMMLVAVAAMSFVSCSNEFEDVNVKNETFSLTIVSEKPALESDSRTEFNNGSIIWTSEDDVRACYYHSSGVWSKYYASTERSLTDNGAKATFTISTEFPAQSAEGTYTFYAGYPKNAIGGGNTTAPTAGELPVVVPTKQAMPKLGTFDASADIMIGISQESVDAPTQEVSVMWSRLVAHGCVTLKNLAAEEGEIVKSVTFTAPESVKLSGNGTINFVDEAMSDLDNNTVTVTPPASTAANVAELPVWFCSAPATIAAGANLTIAVETTRGTYTRTITARDGGIKFMQNRYNTLGINMATATFEAAAVSANVYKQITSMAELTTGEYVVAVNHDGTFYAINSPITLASDRINKEAMTVVTVVDGAITEADAEGCVLTLTANGTAVSIFDGTNYLAHNTSTKIKKQANEATWTVSYESDMFKFVSTADDARALLLNWNSGNYRVTTYAISNYTNTTDYSGLYLFAKTVNNPNVPTLSVDKSELTFAVEGGSQTVTATTTNYDGAITASSDNSHFTVSVSGNVVTVTAPANEESTEQTATITIKAGDLSKSVAVSQAAAAAGVQKVTVAEFIAKADTETYYELTGIVSNVTNTTYGNFDLVDATGTILVYGLYSTDGSQNKYWAASGVKEGDTITIQGQYQLFGTNTHEVVNARYISHISNPKIIPATKEYGVAAAGDTFTVALTTENLAANVSATSNVSWIVVNTVSNTSLSFTVNANDSSDSREGAITLTSGDVSATIIVNQFGKPSATPEDITLDFNTISNKVGGYTQTWEQVCGNYNWSIVNFNNNNGAWKYVKCGRKTYASVASIDTKFSIPWAVSSVVVTVDNVLSTSKVNSTKLEVATDANFSNVVETVTVAIAKGTMTYTVANPGANYYYRLVYDCAFHTSNGIIQISKVVYKAQ